MAWVTGAPGGVRIRWPRRSWAPVWIVLGVAVAYALGSGCAWLLFHASSVGAVFFPPAGVTLGALVLAPRRYWAWVLGAAGAVEFTINIWQGLDPVAASGFVLTNVAEPLAGAALLRRFVPERRIDLTRRPDAIAFLGCAVVAGPLVGAVIGATTSRLAMNSSWWSALGQFWAGDGLAVLTLGAAVVGLGSLRDGVQWRRVWRAGAVLVGTAALTLVAFWPRQVPLEYLPVPLLLAVGFRGRVGTVGAAGFVMAFTANLQSAAGRGPWAALVDQPRLEASTLQVYLAFVVLGAVVLAIAVAERDRARDESRREVEARRRLQALQDVTAGLATAATSAQVIQVLVDQGVGLVADRGSVALRERDGDRLRVWATDPGPPGEVTEIRLDRFTASPIGDAVRTGRPVRERTRSGIRARYPRLAGVPGGAATGSLLVVPVRIGERRLGALAFAFDREHSIHADVVAVARTLAELTGQAVERAELYEAEHAVAHELQRSLLPRISGDLPGVTAAVCYRPAERGHDVGGDWYDVFELPGNRVGVAIGDVGGHGLAAAIAMGRLQQSLRSVALTGASPAEVLESLDVACGAIAGAEYATVGYAEYSPADRTLSYACAGHPPPLLVAGGAGTYLTEARSEPLRLSTRPRPMAQVSAPPEAMLVWYSDGLVERRHEIIDVGLDRLAAIAGRLTGAEPQAWCDRLLAEMTAGHRATDDIVVACLGLDGPPAGGETSAVLRLTIRTPDDLAPTREALRAWSGANELASEQTEALLTACNEALINALKHAYHERCPGPVGLRVVRVDRRQVRVEVSDRGRWRAGAPGDNGRGQGLNLIHRLSRRVVLDLSDNGTRVTVTLPTG
nr:SpoIIE family protein phosphatase [Micromonospora sp. DSM 115978]